MSQIDCGIFPARTEGWNLEAPKEWNYTLNGVLDFTLLQGGGQIHWRQNFYGPTSNNSSFL